MFWQQKTNPKGKRVREIIANSNPNENLTQGVLMCRARGPAPVHSAVPPNMSNLESESVVRLGRSVGAHIRSLRK